MITYRGQNSYTCISYFRSINRLLNRDEIILKEHWDREGVGVGAHNHTTFVSLIYMHVDYSIKKMHMNNYTGQCTLLKVSKDRTYSVILCLCLFTPDT